MATRRQEVELTIRNHLSQDALQMRRLGSFLQRQRTGSASVFPHNVTHDLKRPADAIKNRHVKNPGMLAQLCDC